MSGFFGRRKGKGKRTEPPGSDEEDSVLDLIACRVNDSDGNYFGEVVSADRDLYVIKHDGAFYCFSPKDVRNKFGDLMLESKIDLNQARREGELWKDPGKEYIKVNKFYDFSEQRQREKERNERIHREMELARELAIKSIPPGETAPAPADADVHDAGDGSAIPEEPGDELTGDELTGNTDAATGEGAEGEREEEREEEHPGGEGDDGNELGEGLGKKRGNEQDVQTSEEQEGGTAARTPEPDEGREEGSREDGPDAGSGDAQESETGNPVKE